MFRWKTHIVRFILAKKKKQEIKKEKLMILDEITFSDY
jgi:hypothetical protein